MAAKYEGVKDKVLSPSALNVFLTCSHKFWLEYFEGIRYPPSVALVLGQSVHKGLAYVGEHRNCSDEDVDAIITQHWDSERKRWREEGGIYETKEGEIEEGIEKSKDMVHFYTATHGPPPEGKYEVAFKKPIPDSDWRIQGIVDILGKDDALYDFKTAGRKWDWIRHQKEIQPPIYAMLAWDDWKDYDMTFEFQILLKHTKLEEGKSLDIRRFTVTPERIEGVLVTVRGVIKQIEAEIFYPNVQGGGCYYCPFKKDGRCPAYAGIESEEGVGGQIGEGTK